MRNEKFYETTETFTGSTKMEISSGKRLNSHWEKIEKMTLPLMKSFPVMPLPHSDSCQVLCVL